MPVAGGAPCYALIPARKGSKGLPGKNGLPLAGRPLIVWSIAAARAVPAIDRIVVSTDDETLVGPCRAAGADVPFLRPAALAGDTASSLDVALHAADTLGWPDDAVLVLLQPTSPLRRPEDIAACLDRMAGAGADSCISVAEAPVPLTWYQTIDPAGRLRPAVPGVEKAPRRQDAPTWVVPNGAVYAIRIGALRAAGGFVTSQTVAHVMPAERSVDIDDRLDFALAETLVERGWADDGSA